MYTQNKVGYLHVHINFYLHVHTKHHMFYIIIGSECDVTKNTFLYVQFFTAEENIYCLLKTLVTFSKMENCLQDFLWKELLVFIFNCRFCQQNGFWVHITLDLLSEVDDSTQTIWKLFVYLKYNKCSNRVYMYMFCKYIFRD